MKKWLVLAVLLVAAAGWVGRDYVIELAGKARSHNTESEAYRVLTAFASAIASAEEAAAMDLATGGSTKERARQTAREWRELSTAVFAISYARESETYSSDSSRAGLSMTQYFAVNPGRGQPGFLATWCHARYRATMQKTGSGWKVASFEQSFRTSECQDTKPSRQGQ